MHDIVFNDHLKVMTLMCNVLVRPEVVEAGANQELCAVCQDIANGIHFGALTCEGCKVSPCFSFATNLSIHL